MPKDGQMTDNTYIDPESTNLVLNTLSVTVDENKLLHEVDRISDKLCKLESSGVPTDNLKELHQYVTVLEVQINYLKDRSKKLSIRSNN